MLNCTICDEPATFICQPSTGYEVYSHCGLTFHHLRNPYTGEWEIGRVTFGEEKPEPPSAFKEIFSTASK